MNAVEACRLAECRPPGPTVPTAPSNAAPTRPPLPRRHRLQVRQRPLPDLGGEGQVPGPPQGLSAPRPARVLARGARRLATWVLAAAAAPRRRHLAPALLCTLL